MILSKKAGLTDKGKVVMLAGATCGSNSSSKYQALNPTNPAVYDKWYKSNDPTDEKEYKPSAPVTVVHSSQSSSGQKSFSEMILELPLELTDHYQLATILAADIKNLNEDKSGQKITDKEDKRKFFMEKIKEYHLPKNLDDNKDALEHFLQALAQEGYTFDTYDVPGSRRIDKYTDKLDEQRLKLMPEYQKFTNTWLDGLLAERTLDKDIPAREPLRLHAKNHFINLAMQNYCQDRNSNTVSLDNPSKKTFSLKLRVQQYIPFNSGQTKEVSLGLMTTKDAVTKQPQEIKNAMPGETKKGPGKLSGIVDAWNKARNRW